MEFRIIRGSSGTDITELTRRLHKLPGSNSCVWNRLAFSVRALNVLPLQPLAVHVNETSGASSIVLYSIFADNSPNQLPSPLDVPDILVPEVEELWIYCTWAFLLAPVPIFSAKWQRKLRTKLTFLHVKSRGEVPRAIAITWMHCQSGKNSVWLPVIRRDTPVPRDFALNGKDGFSWQIKISIKRDRDTWMWLK